ncbi:MAG TPA: M17 family peptidase N-terminal domain-containing protein, partial [Streptosporangiaceae bacterium]|nr:M17 family peptidase N-terminal domain-containing protein [Streptosporangiaceae bacterium]
MTTNPLRITQEDARSAAADAIIIGVTQGADGPVPASGSEDIDAALSNTLAATLSALGATGRQDELTKIPSAGRTSAPLIVAAGLGPEDQGVERARLESLRRAAGSAVRALTGGKTQSIALSLPAGDAAETEAVALGALLGRYSFTRYRTTAANGAATTNSPSLTVLSAVAGADDAARRAQALADGMALVRDLVNTSPSQLYPETFAAEAARVADSAGLTIEILDDRALADGGYGGLTGVGQGSVHPPRLVRIAY